MGVQIFAVVVMVNYLFSYLNKHSSQGSFRADGVALSIVLTVMFVGHIVQIFIWAILFQLLNEFGDFSTAFYHSTVNFASLGYGDIVMSERWRLLGALEACNGVLMFGLTAGTLLTVMNKAFSRHQDRFRKISDDEH
ncbi:MAG: two pore domain potassium channel family protein [Pseudomonadales bacterium]|nr:two pore domain potassium channel family protein [Pseudomonadales bacterium]